MCPQNARFKTKNRKRDVDQIYDDHLPENFVSRIKEATRLNEDKPALGQYFCLTCDRYFCTDAALTDHKRQKPHKARLKALREKPHTQDVADWAAGVLPAKRTRKQSNTLDTLPTSSELPTDVSFVTESAYLAVD